MTLVVPVRTNLPIFHAPMIGRDAELAEFSALFRDPACRLLTLVGPGGIGKTRLAIELARRCQESFANGVYFVTLAPLTNAADMLPAIIDALPLLLHEEERAPLTQLQAYLADKQLLLVLDNFEHVMDGIDIVQSLLDASSGLKILVTSREALNIQQEWSRTLGGLNFPQNGDLTDLASYCAMQLFASHASRIRGDFSLQDEASHVARICQLVDGMPLAIELAAGWLKTLPPQAIADEIAHSVDILMTRSRDVVNRHRSIRAVFNHSWELLTSSEQQVFAGLTVFRGGFTREAASEVVAATLDDLANLVDKSLIQRQADGRYTIHELLRQYGAEWLAEHAMHDRMQAVHSGYFLGWLKTLEPDIKRSGQIAALDAIEADFENVRVAWHFAVKHQHYADIAGAVESINFFGDMRGRYIECASMMVEALNKLDWSMQAPDAFLAHSRLLSRHVRLVLMGGSIHDLDLEATINDALGLARAVDHPLETAYCIHLQGIQKIYHKKVNWDQKADQAISQSIDALFRDAYDRFTACGDTFYVAEAATWLGTQDWPTYLSQEGVHSAIREGLDLRRQLGESNGIAWSLFNIAEFDIIHEHYEDGLAALEETFQLMQQIGSIKGVMNVGLRWYGLLVLQGEFEKAVALIDTLCCIARDSYLDGTLQLYGAQALLECLTTENIDLAYEYMQKSQVIFDRPFSSYKDTSVFWGWVVTACMVGDFAKVRKSYRLIYGDYEYWQSNETICTVMEFEPVAYSVYSQRVADTICLSAEALALADEGNAVEATALLGLAFSLPPIISTWLARWPQLTRLRQSLRQTLGDAAYDRAWDRGMTYDRGATILKILSAKPVEDTPSANDALIDPLTERELEVLALLAAGHSNRDVADELVLSIGTVKVHTRHIYNKLGVNSRTQAAAYAREHNLL